MTALSIRNLSEQLVELVRDRILSGAVTPEVPIRQDSLASELGVSKIPLREALARLEQDGLLRSEPNRGYFVRGLTASEAEEVYSLRLRLEPAAAAAASERASEEEQRRAVTLLERLDLVTNEHGEGVGAFNRAFHLALVRPSGRPLTTQIIERLQILSERYVRKHLEPLGRDERANQEHHQLLAAWCARDSAEVARLTSSHIRKTLRDLRGQLRRD